MGCWLFSSFIENFLLPSIGLINNLPNNITVSIQCVITDVMDDVADDLTLYGPTGAGYGWEGNQVRRSPETQNRSPTVEVDEKLRGPQSLT